MFSLSDVTSFLPEPIPASDEAAAAGENSLVVGVDGVDYFVPTLYDEESATFADEEGMSILADTDGDGRVDYVSNVTFNGEWSAWKWQGPHETGEITGVIGEMPPDGVQSSDSAAPDGGAQSWQAERWVCVERGEWG